MSANERSRRQLNRFVLIQWCGESVPENRKGRFSSQAAHVARVLSGAHVVIQARDPADLEPSNLQKKIAAASGSKYGAGNASAPTPAAPSRYEAPKPVGSSYTPVGRPDIASLRASAKPASRPDPVGTSYTSKRDELSSIRSGAQTVATAPPPAPRPVVQPSPIAAPLRPIPQPKAPEPEPEPAKPAFDKFERPAAVVRSIL